MIIKYFLKIKISHEISTDDNEILISDVLLSFLHRPGCTVIVIRYYIGNVDP